MHDLYVLSDLHLGRGRNPSTGRYFSLEAFFYDEDLRRFCRWLCDEAARRGETFKLVFNGDTFDLLRIDAAPGEAVSDWPYGVGEMTPARAAETVRQILIGHPRFVEALALVLAAGHEVVLLPGNHDLELQWAPVQAEVRRAVQARLADRAPDEGAPAEGAPDEVAPALARLHFRPWFYHEPGRIWLEHGCQYDPENAFRYPLRSRLAARGDAGELCELDLPLGNFFQRYLYNGFGAVTFIVPTTRAHLRYAKWLVLNDPRVLVRALTRHGRFAWHWLRRTARRHLRDREVLQNAHEAELAQLTLDSGLGPVLPAVDALKHLRGDVQSAVLGMAREGLRAGATGLAVAVLVAALWFLGFDAIHRMAAGSTWKTVLFLALNFSFLAVGAVGAGLGFFRVPAEPEQGPLARSAAEVARLLRVPIVSFGHTHDEAISPLRAAGMDGSGGIRSAHGWYYNTGTWIAVFTHDVLLPRERVQFTFLQVRGTQAELRSWCPGRGEAVEVVLLDE